MAKILLTHPLFISKSPAEQASASPYFPLGLLYLAGYVRSTGHDVAIFDGTFEEDEEAFTAALTAEQPDVVGISALLPTRATALRLAGMAKDHGVAVLVGGPDPTADPEGYASDPSVDVVVHHEGEQTIVRLLELIDQGRLNPDSLSKEPGVAFVGAHGIVVNPPPQPIDDLDELPLPARDLIEMDRYLTAWEEGSGYRSITVTTARGCPNGCEWCRDAVHGDGWRQRSAQSVASEVRLLKETYDFERLRIVDDVDGIDREWLESWAAEAVALDAAVPFEALNNLKRRDIPMLDVRDTL